MIFLMMMKEKKMTFSDEEKPRFKKIIEEANCILLSTESIQSNVIKLS